MPPSTPVDDKTAWRDRLAALSACLAELDAAMRAGQWEQLERLMPRLNRAMHEVQAHAASPAAADADLLRQTLNLASELQTLAATRQGQIRPLLRAWRSSGRTDPAAS